MWYLYDDDGHCHINKRGHGQPIETPPDAVQVLVAQQNRMTPVLAAWAIVASNKRYGTDNGSMEQYENRLAEYLNGEKPYSRG